MITLTPSGGSPLALPDDLAWPDEFDWAPVVATQQRSLSGALIIHHATAQSGRPITLASNGAAWYPRANVMTLQGWLAAAASSVAAGDVPAAMTLDYHGRTFNVAWRMAGTQPLEAVPAYRLADPDGTHPYLITLRLQEI